MKNNIMTYSIIQVSTFWTSDSLIEKVEETLNKKAKEGYEVVSVSFGYNSWLMHTAYITLRK
jgi:hypothetical protein